MDREEVAHHIVDSAVAIHENAWARITGVRVSMLPDVELGLHGLDFYVEYPISIPSN